MNLNGLKKSIQCTVALEDEVALNLIFLVSFKNIQKNKIMLIKSTILKKIRVLKFFS